MNVHCKSTAHINITLKLKKAARFLIAPHLVKIFNDCIDSGYYPDILKVAKVVLLDKKSSRKDLGNYKPLSIPFPFNKIFEIILHKRLIEFLDKKNILSDYQFRFRKIRSNNLAFTYSHELILMKQVALLISQKHSILWINQ